MTDPVQPSDETLAIDSLDHFVFLLTAWHKNKVDQMKQMLQIPEGIAVSINEAPEIPLAGDLHKGFLMGLTVGLAAFEDLPFLVTTEEPNVSTPSGESGSTQVH